MSRKSLIALVTVFIALAIAGLSRLQLDADPLNLLPGDLPAVAGLQLFQRNIADAQELIVTIRAPEAGDAKAAAQALAALLHERTNLVSSVMWQPVWMERPAEIAELIAYLWLNQPPAEFREMAGRLAPTNINATLEAARRQLATSFSPMDVARRSYDPYDLLNLPPSVMQGVEFAPGAGQDMFESADGTFRVVFVRAKPDISSYRDCIAWVISSGQSKQQVKYQQQQQQSCKSEPIQFQSYDQPQMISDIGFDVDCEGHRVQVQNKDSRDQQTQYLPIQDDGKVQGQMHYQQQVHQDGKGNLKCWVQYVVKFDGRASCDVPEKKALQMQTTVDVEKTTPEQLAGAGINPGPSASPSSLPSNLPSSQPSDFPSPVPSAEPSPQPSEEPSPSPSVSPSPSTSPSPQPSGSPRPSGCPHPRPSASPTLVPVTICVIDNPCPYSGDSDLSC